MIQFIVFFLLSSFTCAPKLTNWAFPFWSFFKTEGFSCLFYCLPPFSASRCTEGLLEQLLQNAQGAKSV